MDDLQYPVIGFGLAYGGELLYCEVFMLDDHFVVHFDGRLIGSVAYNDNFEWMQRSGIILPEAIIVEIGLRIESNYY